MPPSASSLPYLTAHLVEKLKKDPVADYKTSIIHFRDTERYRTSVICQKTNPHVSVTGVVFEDEVGADPHISMALYKWQRVDRKCQLHFTAMELDIPLVHEAIRMSNNPSYKDAEQPRRFALQAEQWDVRLL